MLKKIENVKLKSEFGFPKNKKIVLLSFRKCVDPNWSLYSSNDEFIVSVRKNLIELKNKGYYIVSRRRVGQHDLAAYKTLNSPDIKRYDEVSDLIDQEINGVGGYPDLLYRLLYVSDLLYSADVSGISYVEAALTRCPVYMPYDQEWVDEKCINVNPAIRDMINRNLIFNRITLDNIKYYNNNIKEFVGEWYKTDVNKFKNYVLKK